MSAYLYQMNPKHRIFCGQAIGYGMSLCTGTVSYVQYSCHHVLYLGHSHESFITVTDVLAVESSFVPATRWGQYNHVTNCGGRPAL